MRFNNAWEHCLGTAMSWLRAAVQPKWLMVYLVLGLMLLLVQPASAARKKNKASTATPTAPAHHTRFVYRCGQLYQADPCQALHAERVKVYDPRTSEQHRQATLAQANRVKQLNTAHKATQRSRRGTAAATSLDCRRPGSRPFDACPGKASAAVRPLTPKARRSDSKRPSDGPYRAVSPAQ